MRLESADRHRADPNRAQSRRPNTPLPRRYGRKPSIAVFIGRHIFNRSFRNDVNARVIAFGERTAIKVSSLACKLGHPMDQVPVQPACIGRSIQMTGNLVSCRRLLDERRLGGAKGQRGWKRQPDGGAKALGTSPLIAMRSRLSSGWDGRAAANKAWV